MKKKITLLNVISNIVLQFLTILSGFIIPKIILTYFGSDVNGLVSSLNQFLNYINLLEGGITSVIAASLYKPLVEKNKEKISSIVYTAKKFYNKIGIVFIFYSILLAVLYPILFSTNFSYMYIFSLTIILSLNLFIQYMFSLSLKNLLTADKKIYVVSFTQSIIILINLTLAIISVKIFPSIHILKLITGCLYLLQPLIYNSYIKKNYSLNKKTIEDKELLKDRWNGFSINIAYFIHSSTDVAILTLFTSLSTVSIYGVYSLVTNGIKQLINSVSNGISPTIGHALAKEDFNDLNEKMDLYEYIMFMLVFFFFTIGALLICPFVMIYTKNITDANYYQPVFGILILLSEALYLLKAPHLILSYSAKKFREIKWPCYFEALINIVVSVLLVSKFGLIGVSIGTIFAMLYRLIFQVSFTKTIIPNRKQSIFYKKVLIFTIPTIIGVLICMAIGNIKYKIFSWILHGILYSIILGTLYAIISFIFFKKEMKYLLNYMKRR